MPIMSATAQTDRQREGVQPTLSAVVQFTTQGPFRTWSFWTLVPPKLFCRQTGENPCDLPVSFPPTDRRGRGRLFRQRIAGPDGRRLQRQTRGLEFAAEHETKESPTWLCQREPLSDLWTAQRHHHPIQLLRYSQWLSYGDGKGTPISGVSDYVFWTNLGLPPSTHRNCLAFIDSKPIGSPWFQAHHLDQLPNSLRISNSVPSGITQRDGNRHVRWELLQRRSEESGAIYSQVLPACGPTGPDTGIHNKIRLKNRLRRQCQITRDAALKAEVDRLETFGYLQAQILEEQPVEHVARISPSRWPIAMEVDQTGDENSYSVSPSGHPKVNLSLSLWETRSPCRQSGGSFSPGDRSFVPGSYWEGCRGGEVLIHDRCQRTQVIQTWIGVESHQGFQGQQGSGPERYPEQGFEASPTANGIPPCPVLQCNPPHPSLPYSVVARPSDLYTQTREGSSTTLILLAH